MARHIDFLRPVSLGQFIGPYSPISQLKYFQYRSHPDVGKVQIRIFIAY